MLSRKSIPNLITATRVAAVPVVWGFALAGNHLVAGAGVLYAWVSDALDGVLARRLDAVTPWGSQFDSVADTLMVVSALAWVAILRPDFITEYALPLGIWLGTGAAAYLTALVRFRRLPDVHLYSAKAANFVGFLFVAYLLAFGVQHPVVAWVALGVCIVAAVETLVAVAAFSRARTGVRTVFEGAGRRPS